MQFVSSGDIFRIQHSLDDKIYVEMDMQRNSIFFEKQVSANYNDPESVAEASRELKVFHEQAAQARKEAYRRGQNFHQKTRATFVGTVIDLSSMTDAGSAATKVTPVVDQSSSDESMHTRFIK